MTTFMTGYFFAVMTGRELFECVVVRSLGKVAPLRRYWVFDILFSRETP
jgi:hypothetical protein